MFDYIRRLFGSSQVGTTRDEADQSPLFSGCGEPHRVIHSMVRFRPRVGDFEACFNKHVPKDIVQKWGKFQVISIQQHAYIGLYARSCVWGRDLHIALVFEGHLLFWYGYGGQVGGFLDLQFGHGKFEW